MDGALPAHRRPRAAQNLKTSPGGGTAPASLVCSEGRPAIAPPLMPTPGERAPGLECVLLAVLITELYPALVRAAEPLLMPPLPAPPFVVSVASDRCMRARSATM